MKTDSQIQRTNWQLPEGRGVGWLGERSEGIRKYKLVATKQSQDVEYSIGSIVNIIVMAVYIARWVPE